MPTQLDELSPALEVRLEPLKQYAMVDCVEPRGQVQADQDCDLLVVGCRVHAV